MVSKSFNIGLNIILKGVRIGKNRKIKKGID